MEGGWKTPPPQCYNETKKPSAYRVKRHSKRIHSNHTFNLIISSSVCQLEFSNPRVASNDFTTHKGSHKKKDDTAKATNFKNLLNFSDNNNDSNEGVLNMSRLHPVADLNYPLYLSLIPSLHLNYWILSPLFQVN